MCNFIVFHSFNKSRLLKSHDQKCDTNNLQPQHDITKDEHPQTYTADYAYPTDQGG